MLSDDHGSCFSAKWSVESLIVPIEHLPKSHYFRVTRNWFESKRAKVLDKAHKGFPVQLANLIAQFDCELIQPLPDLVRELCARRLAAGYGRAMKGLAALRTGINQPDDTVNRFRSIQHDIYPWSHRLVAPSLYLVVLRTSRSSVCAFRFCRACRMTDDSIRHSSYCGLGDNRS